MIDDEIRNLERTYRAEPSNPTARQRYAHALVRAGEPSPVLAIGNSRFAAYRRDNGNEVEMGVVATGDTPITLTVPGWAAIINMGYLRDQCATRLWFEHESVEPCIRQAFKTIIATADPDEDRSLRPIEDALFALPDIGYPLISAAVAHAFSEWVANPPLQQYGHVDPDPIIPSRAQPPRSGRSDDRCAVCGWTLADSTSTDRGCARGNCSMRPYPKPPYYDPERARQEIAAVGRLPPCVHCGEGSSSRTCHACSRRIYASAGLAPSRPLIDNGSRGGDGPACCTPFEMNGVLYHARSCDYGLMSYTDPR